MRALSPGFVFIGLSIGCLHFDCHPSDITCNPPALALYLLTSGNTSATDLRQVVSGASHTCALLSTGAVRCWGLGANGRLGYNNSNNIGDGIGLSILSAGDVPLGDTAVHLSAGNGHTCAVLSTGAIRCWGVGSSGQLGHNSTASIGDTPGTSISNAGDIPLGGTATQVAAGFLHTCALMVGGTVRCWGSGGNGVLGYNNSNAIGDGVGLSISAAGDVPIGGTATQVTGGNTVSCALLTTGAVRCWGFGGGDGRLGYNATTNVGDGVGLSILASGDVSLGGTAMRITAGDLQTCAMLTTGAIRCWGNGSSGRLGYNNTNSVADGVGLSITAAGDVPYL